ncbi:MAG: RluA family pseudouridine synthase [Anaerolineales bacterium]|nr:RluA family pseudouridine synthase [Anaerolineales bacterium]
METDQQDFKFNQPKAVRLDHYLVSVLPAYSRSFLQNLIKSGHVLVDGIEIRKTGYKLEGTKSVQVVLPPPVDLDIIPEDIPLDIVYQNNDLFVINKPAGMVVHPSAGHHSGTLVHAILAYCPDIEGVGGVRRPGIVHRLDKDTSGLILVARNDRAHHFLQKQFKQRKVEKRYIALVDGHPPTPTGRVEAAINRDPSHRQKMAVVPAQKGRMAISEYQVLEDFPNHAIVEVAILTGRTHQIRLHMAFLDCPIVGDRVYGHKKLSLPVSRQMLHARYLKIDLPDGTAGAEFTAAIPDDFRLLLEELRNLRR